ncbi:MAG: ABC transporter ATP-binding protein [Planctomycetota bacterium]|jgi:ABC-type polysaccharide/polyol phosphate transport system ATPase subunit
MTAAPSSTSDSGSAAGRVRIEARDLGVCYRLRGRHPGSVRETLLRWRPRRPAPLLWAVRGANFAAHEGQTLGIIGPNGAGKSTLCLVLARIFTPDEGTVTVQGRVSPLLTLGAGFNRDLSGRANIQLCGAFLGIPRATMEDRIDEIIDFSELGDFIDEPIRHYSGGMRSRLGFSVAAALDPEILILDEVLAVGDRSFRAKSQKRLEEMMAQSKLIVIVSHALDFLREICTHCLWLESGRPVQCGEAGAVLDAYEQSPSARVGGGTAPR